MPPLKAGDTAPDFELPGFVSQPEVKDVTVKLSESLKNGPVILMFHPLAFTAVCETEVCTVGKEWQRYAQAGAQVVSISVDSMPAKKAWVKAIAPAGLPYPVASDFWPHGKAAELYGVLRPQGFSERATFVIGRDGKIVYADVRENIRELPPFDEVLAAARNAA